MESIVKSSIFDYLISNILISSNQFVFLPDHSCTMQLFHVMDIITGSLDHGQPVDVIYLDLQKAFDTVPHNRLIRKVESYGISGKFLNWIKGFAQCVVLNGCKSGWKGTKWSPSRVNSGTSTIYYLIYLNLYQVHYSCSQMILN